MNKHESLDMSNSELHDLRSKKLTTKVSRKSRSATKVFWKTQIVMSNSIRITS